jgi:hypothetical protein
LSEALKVCSVYAVIYSIIAIESFQHQHISARWVFLESSAAKPWLWVHNDVRPMTGITEMFFRGNRS